MYWGKSICKKAGLGVSYFKLCYHWVIFKGSVCLCFYLDSSYFFHCSKSKPVFCWNAVYYKFLLSKVGSEASSTPNANAMSHQA